MQHFNANIKQLIRDGKNVEAKAIIKRYSLYRAANLYGTTWLHYSALHGNETIAQYLLEDSSNVNAQDCRGRTPLMYALTEEHYRVIQILLDAGADILMKNNDNESSLRILLKRDEHNVSILKLILRQLRKQCSNVEETAGRLINAGGRLDHAVYMKDAKVVEYMLQQGFSVNYAKNATDGQTILHLAISLYDAECVNVLLKYKAAVFARNFENNTYLNYLYCNHTEFGNPNQIEILKALLDAGAMPMLLCNALGYFQATSTLMCGPREAIRVLLESGKLDFEATDTYRGCTVLHYLARNRNSGIAEELEKYPVKLNANVLDRLGNSPLHYAANNAKVDMVQYLLKVGADANEIHNEDRSLLDTAFSSSGPDLECQSDQCVEILLQHNSDPQHVIVINKQEFTIFDANMTRMNNSREDRLKPVVAQIALLEKCGKPITTRIRKEIYLRHELLKYFVSCRKLLGTHVSGNTTFCELLTANDKTVSKLMDKQKLVTKLMRIRRKHKLVSSFSFYNNLLKKRLAKIFLNKKLKNKAAAAISRLSDYRIDESSIAIERVIGYLDEHDLRQVYEM